ncbi:MAG: MBG domain-containing protein, partial [Thermoguttaceae bacterium]|nr:MBG domain-containing protein [Thermoguttaceae bacterium]
MRFLASHPTLRFLAALLILAQTMASPAPLLANPTGGEVVAGSAAIASHGSTLDVTTHTDRAVINWQGFSIGAGETANFIQPGAGSAVLNRVTTPDNPSAIYGQLNSNGNVFLVNPSGILIGPTGVINANGFTASVFDISNHEFMAGGPLTFRGDSTAGVVNQGAIYTGAGGVALLGHQVINSGLVSSDGGAITLATGGSITLADGSRYIQADLKTLASGISETASLIRNSGTVRATGALKTGGEVYLVNPAGNILHDGTIKADRLAEAGRSGGSVKLEAAHGETRVEGSIDVSGDTGGRVEVLGQKVELAGAAIDATGTHGGGVILAGGDFQGGNPDVLNAQHTIVDADSVLNADATALGDGGRIILWADGSMEFHGSITARGGEYGGDGGFAEVSGRESLNYLGWADLSASGGATGTLLLDPGDFTIEFWEAFWIVGTLASSHVVVQTVGSQSGNGDIFINSSLSYNASNSLTLLAHRHIRANTSVQNSGSGAINLVAGWDGTTAAPGGGNIVSIGSPFDFDAIVSNNNAYGNHGGSVFIDASNAAVSVGSRFGATNVAGNNLVLQAGSTGNNRFAQLGYRGNNSANSPINVYLKGNLTASGGASTGSYAKVGHGENERNRTYVGAITIDAEGYVSFQGGSGEKAYAQLGHGGYKTDGNHSGTIQLDALGDITFRGGLGKYSYAQLGHGGYDVEDSNLSGHVTIDAGGNVRFQGGDGNGEYAYAQLGHGGYAVDDGDLSGDITINAVGDLTFLGGSKNYAYAQLGHGGYQADDGDLSGDIAIDAGGDLTLQAGSGNYTYAQLGHGGYQADDGHHSGDIEVTIDGSLRLVGGNTSSRYALIGHGSHDNDESVRGDITLSIGKGAALTNAFIGHLIKSGGLYAYGNTYIAIGVQDFSDTNTTDALVSDRYSRIVSAPYSRGGQLRFYLPLHSSFQMADGARINGVDVDTFNDSTPFPNEQGQYSPFDGPYNINLGDGNFAFYFGPASLYELFITAYLQTKVYGSADPLLTFLATGFKPGDDESILTGALARDPGENVGQYAINLGTLSAGSNYTINYTGDYLTITPALLSVVADSQTKVYGSSDPALTFAASGFQWSDDESILTGALAREPGENVGQYAINLGTLSAGSNYTINYTGDYLTIT